MLGWPRPNLAHRTMVKELHSFGHLGAKRFGVGPATAGCRFWPGQLAGLALCGDPATRGQRYGSSFRGEARASSRENKAAARRGGPHSEKLNERSGNVIENKGTLWRS